MKVWKNMKIYRVVGRTGDGYEGHSSWTAKVYKDSLKAEKLVKTLKAIIEAVFNRAEKIKITHSWYEKDTFNFYKYCHPSESKEEYHNRRMEQLIEEMGWRFKERCFQRFIKPLDGKYSFDSIGYLEYDIEEIEVEE